MTERNKLIKGWLKAQDYEVDSDEYDNVSWATDELFKLAYDAPKELLDIVIDILKDSSSINIKGALGAGVLEDLIVHHGDDYIDEIVALSETSLEFKECLSFTYIDQGDVTDITYSKFQALKEFS